MKKIFFVAILIFSYDSFSFTYNYDFINYKGGVISQLNNCGPVYTDNGKYLLGQRNLSAQLTTTNNDVIGFVSVAGGVASVTSSNDIYFSPDGRYLDGGAATRKIYIMPKKYPGASVGKWPSAAGNYQNMYGAVGNSLILIQRRLDHKYPTEREIGRTCSGRPPRVTCVPRYEEGYLHEIKIFNLPGGQVEIAEYSSIRQIDRILGGISGRIYVQFKNGDIGSYNSLQAIKNIDSVAIHHVAASKIEKIIPYRNGLLAYGKNSIYWSSSLNQVVAGNAVTRLYSGARNVTSVVNYGGHNANGGTKGLIAAFDDGYVYFSPDGNNISGGGSTGHLVRPFDEGRIKSQFKLYMDSLSQAAYLIPDGSWAPNQFYNPYTGATLNIDDMKVRLLNRGATTDYAENFIFLNGEGTSFVLGMAFELNGNPAQITLYDKGWDNWEYKWRDRGTRVGFFNHNVTGKYIGTPEIRIKASSGCVLAVSYERIGGEGEGFSVLDFNLNSDFTVANNNVGVAAMQTFFAEGGASYPWSVELLNSPLTTKPSRFTFFELLSWAAYNTMMTISDALGYPLKGVDILYLQTEEDRARTQSYR